MGRRPSLDNVDKFHDQSIYIPTRTIYVGSEHVSVEHGESGTDASMAERIIKNLSILEGINKEPITIILNNIGGDVYHGMAVYDVIKACESSVTIKAIGHAMSMGSVIFQAGDKRLMYPNAVQMFHYGSIAVSAEALTVYKVVEEYKRVDRWMERMYLENIREKQPKFSLSRLRGMLKHDTFLTAEQSVELGLADAVIEYPSS